MKVIKYGILTQIENENGEIFEEVLQVETTYTEKALERVKNKPNVVSYEIVGEDDPIVPTEQDDINAMLVDMEYRLTLLELGVTEEE